MAVFGCNIDHQRLDYSQDNRANLCSDPCAGESALREQVVMERFEARLEVDNREAVADSSLTSCIVSRMVERFVGNILAGSKASNRFPDAGAAVDRSNRMDLVDMLDSAFDAWAENSQAAGVHIGMAVSVLNHHLLIDP